MIPATKRARDDSSDQIGTDPEQLGPRADKSLNSLKEDWIVPRLEIADPRGACTP
jgi:hypothetical protein